MSTKKASSKKVTTKKGTDPKSGIHWQATARASVTEVTNRIVPASILNYLSCRCLKAFILQHRDEPNQTSAPQDSIDSSAQASNEATLNKLPLLLREIAKHARLLMQGDLCTSHAFPESSEAKLMAGECVSEAVSSRMTDASEGIFLFGFFSFMHQLIHTGRNCQRLEDFEAGKCYI